MPTFKCEFLYYHLEFAYILFLNIAKYDEFLSRSTQYYIIYYVYIDEINFGRNM